MPVRNSAKAIVVDEGRILLNRCTSRFGEYYALPGGGQNPGETLTDAVTRELLEETGYQVKPMRLSGIYERISERPGEDDDKLCHKIYFIFVCRLLSGEAAPPTEHDRFQIGLTWVNIKDIPTCNLFPHAIRDNIQAMLSFGETIFIGSEKEKC
jgi:ADP-ribose pyrophosphatase YjhB (NUDIX family)